MPFPCSSTVAEHIIHSALDLLDKRKQELCAVVESEQTTPDEKYEALVSLAYMTGILSNAAAEHEKGPSRRQGTA